MGAESKALYYKKKSLCPQAPSLHPLKLLAATIKSKAGKIRQRRWGRRKPSILVFGLCLKGKGVVFASDKRPLLERNGGGVY